MKTQQTFFSTAISAFAITYKTLIKQVIVLALFAIPTFAGTTYYISSSTGNDANNGTSSSTPWKSWANCYYGYNNSYAFPAGTQILVKCGDTISGAMYVTMNGTSNSPCIIASYGTGPRPVMLGDFSKNVWTPVAGCSGYYKTYAPMGGLLSEEQWEYANGTWQSMTLMNDITPSRASWLSSMPLGSIGPLNNQNDTIFIRTFDGTMPTPATCCLAWDGMTLNNSKYVTIRDWDIKGFHSALYMWQDTNLTIRKCFVHDNDHLTVMLEYNRYFSVDSCKADSCAYTCFYSYESGDGQFTYDTVLDVTNIVKGRDWGTDREMCAFGHQGDPSTGQGGSNVKIDHCYTWNIYDSAINSYYDSKDTITNNVFYANQAGIYQLGNGYYVANNVVTIMGNISTRKGTQMDGSGTGLNKTINNTFNNVQWGLAVNSMGAGSSVQFSGNVVNGYDANSYLDMFSTTSGVTSTNNSFSGPGQWLSGSNAYTTIAKFQSGTGLEAGSAWSSIANPLPVQVTSFTGVVKGYTVALNWKTATEVNTYTFEVERRITTQWESVCKIPAGGTSNAPLEYAYVDSLKNVSSGNIFYRLKSVDNDGSFQYNGDIEVAVTAAIPNVFTLNQNYPNPFNPTTTISYQLQSAGKVSLKVYDMLGREIATLVNEEKGAGYYSAVFNGSRLSSGIYIYRLQAGSFTETKKFVLLK